jgi:hypothetical protein
VPQPSHSSDEADRFGFDDTRDYLGAALSRLLPRRLVRGALAVSVETDRDSYGPGDPVKIRTTIRNRYPVPVEIGTASRRRWGWSVDGLLEASDEPRRDPGGTAGFSFRARERKTITWTWDGRVKHVDSDGTARWEPLSPGEHQIRVYVATANEKPAAATTIRIE